VYKKIKFYITKDIRILQSWKYSRLQIPDVLNFISLQIIVQEENMGVVSKGTWFRKNTKKIRLELKLGFLVFFRNQVPFETTPENITKILLETV